MTTSKLKCVSIYSTCFSFPYCPIRATCVSISDYEKEERCKEVGKENGTAQQNRKEKKNDADEKEAALSRR